MKRLTLLALSLLAVFVFIFGCAPKPIKVPEKPTVISPADGANFQSLTPTFRWNFIPLEDYPASYAIYLGESPEKMDLIVSGATETTYQLKTPLKDDTVYYWKVVAQTRDLLIESPVWSFRTVKAFTINVTLGRTGEAVPNIKVKILRTDGALITEKTTDASGKVKFDPTTLPDKFNVELEPPFGYAKSRVVGLMKNDFVGVEKTIPIQFANLEPDPTKQEFPKIELRYTTMAGTPLNLNDVKEDFRVYMKVTGENVPSAAYVAISDTPGGGGNILNYNNRISLGATKEATVTVSIAGKPLGDNYLSVIYYDLNNVRVEIIERIKITREVKETELPLFEPIPASKFGYVNMIAYTRNRAVSFYSKGKAERLASTMAQNFGKVAVGMLNIPEFEPRTRFERGLNAAPSGSNLWIEVNWISYDIASSKGLIGPGVQKPEGYYIYRSFDGKYFVKIGYSNTYRFVDWSAELAPNKKVWYAVSSYYGNRESALVMLGSVEPLDNFNVQLLTPPHKATGVSRQPVFSWKPTKAITSSEATPTYNYGMWIYDLVQSEYYIVPVYLKDGNLYVYNFKSTKPDAINVKFQGSKGSEGYKDLLWVFLVDAVYYYPSEKLEAGKTYNWGVDYAYAEVYDYDSVAYSIAIDAGYGIDPIGGVEPDLHGQFTTGDE